MVLPQAHKALPLAVQWSSSAPPPSSRLTLVSMVMQNPSAAVRPVKCSAISSLPCPFEPTTQASPWLPELGVVSLQDSFLKDRGRFQREE